MLSRRIFSHRIFDHIAYNPLFLHSSASPVAMIVFFQNGIYIDYFIGIFLSFVISFSLKLADYSIIGI